MKTFTARVEYIDVREITIEAETLEDAQAKYDEGNWADETTVNFYSNREIRPLREDTPHDDK